MNTIKKIIAAAALVAIVAGASMAQSQYQDDAGHLVNVSNSRPMPFSDATGGFVSGSQKTFTLATNSVTLLSSIASFTLPCTLKIQCNNIWRYSLIATTTVSTVQESGQRVGQWDNIDIKLGTTTPAISLIASSSAEAVGSMQIITTGRDR